MVAACRHCNKIDRFCEYMWMELERNFWSKNSAQMESMEKPKYPQDYFRTVLHVLRDFPRNIYCNVYSTATLQC